MNILIVLSIVVLFIILASVKWKIHPFFSLIIAAVAAGAMLGLDGNKIISSIAGGFGQTLSSIGLVIAFGTVIGVFLEKMGATTILANALLGCTGLKKSPLAMNIAGFVISIPVFCDSGFIILSSINKALSKRTGMPLILFSIALATGLYASHVFVPPTPGPLAAAAVVGADLGLVMLWGLAVAIPVSLTGYFWASFISSKLTISEITIRNPERETGSTENVQKGLLNSILPIVVPIVLIALKSIVEYPGLFTGEGFFFATISFFGNPVMALLTGVVLAFLGSRSYSADTRNEWVVHALREGGTIILITGAGGSFGNILRTVDIGSFVDMDPNFQVGGLLMAFGMAAILKTAQGSSTVAIITTAAIMAPMLESLGLQGAISKVCSVLAIGAGAMTVSHVNDSYFWVVSQFSGMDVNTALRSHTAATFFQGIVGLVMVLGIQLLFGG
ncbi:MAG: GntP family permease [Sediminicola sp.]